MTMSLFLIFDKAFNLIEHH